MVNIEIWKEVKLFDNYQVSNFGNIKSKEREVFIKGKKSYIKKEKEIKGSIAKDGYKTVSLKKEDKFITLKIHQFVAMAFLNHIPCGFKLVVNHKNLDKLDNRLENLEIITNRENCNKLHLKSSSKYTGVCWDKSRSKWISMIQINGKRKYLGRYKTELDANNAYRNELFKLIN